MHPSSCSINATEQTHLHKSQWSFIQLNFTRHYSEPA
jgi:hypothetical protein